MFVLSGLWGRCWIIQLPTATYSTRYKSEIIRRCCGFEESNDDTWPRLFILGTQMSALSPVEVRM